MEFKQIRDIYDCIYTLKTYFRNIFVINTTKAMINKMCTSPPAISKRNPMNQASSKIPIIVQIITFTCLFLFNLPNCLINKLIVQYKKSMKKKFFCKILLRGLSLIVILLNIDSSYDIVRLNVRV
ncbi:hypothetical protein BN1058_01400 [Paraliobacillus sp. PM-2]|nr:hypothetical protein BN1058_01400 [Paraliobacillus sp. PM-2]